MMLIAQANLPTTLDAWAERLQKFGKNIPQEQIFIHTDNTCYFLGDTLFYKAYVRRSDGIPSRLSKVLYVELLNQDGYLVQRQLLELERGEAHSNFVLNDTLYGGYYELRAYTRWQLNWGETEHPHTDFAEKWFFSKKMAKEYYRDYEKLYSKVFPVYDKPKVPGDFEHFMTLRPLRRQYKAENALPEAVVQFFPEGGHLVAGVKNRVAFEANDDDGMHIEGTIVIMDASGNKVAEAKTEQRGRGCVEFVPVSGTKYMAQFTWKYKMAQLDLPKVEADGCAIMVMQEKGEVKVNLALSGTAASESLGMTVMNQGQLLDFKELGTGEQFSVTLTSDKLETGVCQVTVFNAEGRIYADRLFFFRKVDFQSQNITFDGFNNVPTQPFDPISLQIKTNTPNGHISVAVRDAAHTEYIYDSGNILTEMLLSSQIRGFVEQPEYFFEKDDAEHQRALDLLLMIQGWRRYDWHTMATPGAFVLNHMPEQTPLMTGEVNKYQTEHVEDLFAQASEEAVNGDVSESGNSEEEENPKPDYGEKETLHDAYGRFNKDEGLLKNEVLVHAKFVKPKEVGSDGVVGEVVTQKGQFTIQSPRFFDGCIMELAASDTTKWKENKHVWFEGATTKYGDINYAEFYVRLRPVYPRFVKPYNWYQEHLAQAPKGSVLAEDWLNDGSRTLQEVTIGAKHTMLRKFDASKPAFVIDAYAALNEATDAGLCTGYFIGQQRFITDISRTYIGDMNMDRPYDIVMRLNTQLLSEKSALQQSKESSASKYGVQNETAPTWTSNVSTRTQELFNKFTNLDKVYIYTDYSPRREGDKHFEGSNQPEVTIDLRTYPDTSKRIVRRDRYYILPGFSSPDDFYQPNYSKKPLPETKDYRRTLYWNPNLQLDASGAAKIQFYNNSKPTQIAISAEGMASDGTLLTGKSMPEDR
ncbi:MAG: hypothetical protein J6W52_06175 [Bacteroidaceae bacterium]|nr:hypothetical protein [Bacteroidaceae bacterium]